MAVIPEKQKVANGNCGKIGVRFCQINENYGEE